MTVVQYCQCALVKEAAIHHHVHAHHDVYTPVCITQHGQTVNMYDVPWLIRESSLA